MACCTIIACTIAAPIILFAATALGVLCESLGILVLGHPFPSTDNLLYSSGPASLIAFLITSTVVFTTLFLLRRIVRNHRASNSYPSASKRALEQPRSRSRSALVQTVNTLLISWTIAVVSSALYSMLLGSLSSRFVHGKFHARNGKQRLELPFDDVIVFLAAMVGTSIILAAVGSLGTLMYLVSRRQQEVEEKARAVKLGGEEDDAEMVGLLAARRSESSFR